MNKISEIMQKNFSNKHQSHTNKNINFEEQQEKVNQNRVIKTESDFTQYNQNSNFNPQKIYVDLKNQNDANKPLAITDQKQCINGLSNLKANINQDQKFGSGENSLVEDKRVIKLNTLLNKGYNAEQQQQQISSNSNMIEIFKNFLRTNQQMLKRDPHKDRQQFLDQKSNRVQRVTPEKQKMMTCKNQLKKNFNFEDECMALHLSSGQSKLNQKYDSYSRYIENFNVSNSKLQEERQLQSILYKTQQMIVEFIRKETQWLEQKQIMQQEIDRLKEQLLKKQQQ